MRLKSRVGAVALYTVLWTVVAEYRKWRYSAPHRTKTPEPINTKAWAIDNVSGTTKYAEVHNDRLGVAAPHIGEVYGWWSFYFYFSGDLLGKRTADPERSSPTCYRSIDAVSAKDVPFGGLIDTSHPMRELSPQNPSFSGCQWGFPAWMFTCVSRHRTNMSRSLIAQIARLGKIHNVQF
jgi:hypothetical protein